ncbi:MAG: hypothetical protein LBU53_13625 [Zoogloeaceae bacterium]|jgi:hypothetical protein|nr:hypothetical protein [Zoogloeaceae bacterium]
MGIKYFLLSLLLSIPVFADEAKEDFDKKFITDVDVIDYEVGDANICDSSSIYLTHRDAKIFFTERAQQVTHKILHDYFYWSPCYMVGTLKYKGELCSWDIYASGIGNFSCGEGRVWYFACDDGCDDLLRKKED